MHSSTNAPGHRRPATVLHFKMAPRRPQGPSSATWRVRLSVHRRPPRNQSNPTMSFDWFRCSAKLARSEEHTSELQSLMRTSYAVFCLKKTQTHNHNLYIIHTHHLFLIII